MTNQEIDELIEDVPAIARTAYNPDIVYLNRIFVLLCEIAKRLPEPKG